jgi:serine/threonine protein kinase
LTEKHYDQSADIWSLGLILAELLRSTKSQKCKCRHLYRGNSCYPISPGKNEDVVVSDDQLFKIFETNPDIIPKMDLSFLSSDEGSAYAIKIFKNTKFSENLSKLFANSMPEHVEILKKMLEFNPHFRPSA